MKEEIKRRIEELEEFISYKWTTFKQRDVTEEKLERLKQLLSDLENFY